MAMAYSIAKTPVATKNLASDEKFPETNGVTSHGLPLASVELRATPDISNVKGYS